MQKEFFDSINKAGRQAFDAAREVNAVNTSTFESVLEKQLEFADQFVALSTKQADIISNFKDAPTAIQAQTSLMKEVSEQAAGNARDAMEFMNKTREAYDKLFQKSLKETTDVVKKAQKSVSKAA